MEPVRLDLRGLNCPLPVLRSRKAIRAMAPGSRLLVEATDPLAVIDLPHWAREDGHVLIDYANRDGIHCFLIECGPATGSEEPALTDSD